MTATCTISNAFQHLLECENSHSPSEDDASDVSSVVETLERQGRLCSQLAHALVSGGSKQKSPSLRGVLGDQASALGPFVGPLLRDRVDSQSLLPATQDVAANEEILEASTNARTLTLPAVQAAWLYAQVLNLPGALGSGLVDLEWLTALTAVVRRWSLECCGREDELVTGVPSKPGASSGKPPKSPTKSPPKKKSRQSTYDSEDSEDEEDAMNLLEGSQENVLQLGLKVALAVCGIPQQREFASWSFEAREVVLDALCASFGTTAAFQSVLYSYKQEPQIATRIIAKASTALQACLTHARTETSSTSGTARQHETAILVMRGLLHLLQFKEILPNGEKGKVDAHLAAATVLQGLMEGFTRSSLNVSKGRRSSLGETTNHQTPSRRRRRSSGGLVTPATGKTPGRRRRSSVDAPGTTTGQTPLLSPALKGRRSSTGTVGLTPLSSLHSKPRPVWSVFVSLLQKLATTQGLERASARGPTVDAIVSCTPALPLAERAHFLRYLLKLAKSKVSCHRLVACELLGRILAEDWLSTHQEDKVAVDRNSECSGHGGTTPAPDTPASTGSDEDGTVALPAALWKALQGRLVDKLAAVRARAATSIEAATAVHPEWLDTDLMSSLRKRALKDETATVRKAAVLALKQVLLSDPGFLSDLYITTFCELCQDASLLVRKAAAESITSLLETYLDHPSVGSLLEQAWSTCVLPMVLDEDVASKAIGSLDQVVISPLLCSIEDGDFNAVARAAAWRLLAHVATPSGSQGASKGSKQALHTALRQMTLDGPDRIQMHLWEHAAKVAEESVKDQETSEAQVMGVWCLLEALLLSAASSKQVKAMVQTTKRSSKTPILETLCGTAWKVLLDRCCQTPSAWLHGTLRSCLCVISRLAPGLDEEAASTIHSELHLEIKSLSFPPEVTGASIQALSAITARLNAFKAKAKAVCSDWIQSVYQACEDEMALFVKFVEVRGPSMDCQKRLVRALFCVGELSMVGFRADDDEVDVRTGKSEDEDPLRGMHEKPTKRLQELVQTLLPPTLPGSYHAAVTPTSIRAHAFTVLGKLCLRDDILAKNSLNLLARELQTPVANTSPAVQSNALLVLGDLCVRYTNMADRYLPVMASCLQSGASDPETNMLQSNTNGSAITRKHAVLLLSSLLLQDYIKWRGLLFHRFLVACSDENEEVATLAENVLSGPLSNRNPKLFFNHFVEALFVLNKCTAHPIYVAAANQGDGGSGIAVGFDGIYLSGELGRLRRRRMYEFLLSKLSDEEKIGVTARLAKEVLGEAVSSEGDLGKVCQMKNQDFGPKMLSAWNVVTDAFAILTSRGIKVGKIQDDDLMDDPNVPNPSRQVSMAKNRLLSKISRKQLIEIVLPILCNLKTKLQSSCSPLLKDLMTYLLDIFQAYKTEVKEFLANDPTLLQEIEYDARQHAANIANEAYS